MKFTDGYWRLRPGLTALRPVEVESVHATDRTLTVYWASRPIRQRNDTMNMPLLTTVYSSPAPGVIRISNRARPETLRKTIDFGLASSDTHPVEVEIGEDVASFTSGALSVRVRLTGERSVEILRGDTVLTTMDRRSLALVTDQDGRRFLHDQLDLAPQETVYGLGERFGPTVRNGQSVEMWNIDSGTSSEHAYKNVPFCWTSQGYGIVVDSPGRVGFEVASEAVSRLQVDAEAESLDLLLIDGPTPKEILGRLTDLAGSSPRIPAWSFGLWLSSSFTTDYDEATVLSFVDGMKDRGIPLSVFHFDSYWMRAFHWCDFVWNPEIFPDPRAMLARLHDRGVRVCVWINPYIAERSALFAEGVAGGYLLKRLDGSVYQTDYWQNGMGIVDFTNPAAAAWYRSKLAVLLEMGVDCFKTDFGEEIPTDVAWFDGSDPEHMHNYYSRRYNSAVFSLIEEQRGEGEAMLFSRAATLGGNQLPVHWGGDCQSNFAGMLESLRGGLSLAATGFSYWSHDIGGFEGRPDPAVFKRWVPFGLLSSHSRLHGSTSYRVPWEFDEEAVDVTRIFAALKRSLTPYLLTAADEAHRTGVPILRPMPLEFPDDHACRHLDTQYMLGPDILVAPVFSAEGKVAFYVPAGTWTHLLDGRRYEGGRWYEEVHGFESLPVLVRPGAVLPLVDADSLPDEDRVGARTTLHVYPSDSDAPRRSRVVDGCGEVVVDVILTPRDGELDIEGHPDLLPLGARFIGHS